MQIAAFVRNAIRADQTAPHPFGDRSVSEERRERRAHRRIKAHCKGGPTWHLAWAKLADEVDSRQSGLLGEALPKLNEAPQLRVPVRAEKVEERFATDAHISTVVESRFYRAKVSCVVVGSWIVLLNKDSIGGSVPSPCPVGVRPCQAKGKIWLAGRQYLLYWSLKNPATVAEPIVPIAKSVDTVLTRQVSLMFASLGETEIIETEFARKVRLMMTTK